MCLFFLALIVGGVSDDNNLLEWHFANLSTPPKKNRNYTFRNMVKTKAVTIYLKVVFSDFDYFSFVI